jgi:methyl-accepting chemotaxis protein
MQTTLPKSYLTNVVRVSTALFAGGAILTALGFYLALAEQGASYAGSFSLLAKLNHGLVNRALLLFSLLMLLSNLALVVIAVIYSHRVAGPLYRLGMDARRIASGDLTVSTHLRKTDVLQPLADDLNELAGYYRQLLVQAEEKTRDCAALMDGLTEQPPHAGGPGPYDKIRERADEVKAVLNQVKL